ncbi:hypothetical protein PUMCH_004131 [Australozyma saopauloensis]|uniref:Uncharacterized protein n=1 Tax=Australozyma saopauloensis TaxID=291208 RepID=A0AAX4HE00_9ASCO|nr:hypothetical protein PUMCH_004131 [[Candida] saopauloensis]
MRGRDYQTGVSWGKFLSAATSLQQHCQIKKKKNLLTDRHSISILAQSSSFATLLSISKKVAHNAELRLRGPHLSTISGIADYVIWQPPPQLAVAATQLMAQLLLADHKHRCQKPVHKNKSKRNPARLLWVCVPGGSVTVGVRGITPNSVLEYLRRLRHTT